jgi:hypothetical protein
MTKNYLAIPTYEQMVNILNDVFLLNIDNKEVKPIPTNSFFEWKQAIDDCTSQDEIVMVINNCPELVKNTPRFCEHVEFKLNELGVI